MLVALGCLAAVRATAVSATATISVARATWFECRLLGTSRFAHFGAVALVTFTDGVGQRRTVLMVMRVLMCMCRGVRLVASWIAWRRITVHVAAFMILRMMISHNYVFIQQREVIH
jgi:hypothetical protein